MERGSGCLGEVAGNAMPWGACSERPLGRVGLALDSPRAMWSRKRSWILRAGFGIGLASLGVHRPSFAQDSSGNSLRSAKLFGKVSLSPIEPVRGLLVEVGEGDRCCSTLPEQEVWPSTEFELDLEERKGYRFHSIGVFVEPQDGAKDAFYALFPGKEIEFDQGVASFEVEAALKPIRIYAEGVEFDEFDLSAKAESHWWSKKYRGTDFVSVREWHVDGESNRDFKIWVPEGASPTIELVLTAKGIDGRPIRYEWIWYYWSKPELSTPPFLEGQVHLDIDGATSALIGGDLTVLYSWHGRSDDGLPHAFEPFFFEIDAEGKSQLLVPDNRGVGYRVKPTLYFEDGSATVLGDMDLNFAQDEDVHELPVHLTPQKASLSVASSFDLEKLRFSVDEHGWKEASATQEVTLLRSEGQSEIKTANATLQLPANTWKLSGLSVNHAHGLWTSRYDWWKRPTEEFESPSEELMSFGQVASLVDVYLRPGHEEARRREHYVRYRDPSQLGRETGLLNPESFLRGSSVQRGEDARGYYSDKIHLSSREGLVVGRSGHRYKFVTEDLAGEQLSDPFEVTFGRPQKLRAGPLGFVGTSSGQEGRCNRLEMMYQGISSGGSVTLTGLPIAPTPPRGYLVWPEQGAQTRSFDIRRHFELEAGSTAQVCVQFDEARLAQAGLSPQDLTLAHRLTGGSNDPGCDDSNRYLGDQWCGMPKVEPQIMSFLLGHDDGCSWHCALANANELGNLALLRAHPSQRPTVHCQDRDYFAHGKKGWRPVKAPEHLAAAYEEGKRLGWRASKEAWKGKDRSNVADYEAVRRVFVEFFDDAFSQEPSDPVELCKLRGQVGGYVNWMMFGPNF